MVRFSGPRTVPVHTLTVGFIIGLAVGCGGSKFTVVPAKGKVVCSGAPVTSGSVSFSPVAAAGNDEPGKSATAAVGADGTFVLTTYDQFDGAIVGKHSVQYVGAEGEEGTDESESDGSGDEVTLTPEQMRERAAKKRVQQCMQNGEIFVEVTASGENDFLIELTPGTTQDEEVSGE